MVAPLDSPVRLCKHDCYSPHLGQDRQHLPLCLIWGPHSGTADGSVPQTPNFPQIWHFGLDIVSGETLLGTKFIPTWTRKLVYKTQFLSVATWSLLSSRIDTWKKQGVRDLRVHVIFSPFLPRDTEVYRVTGLVKRYSLRGSECMHA